MKKLYSLFILCIALSSALLAQAPQSFAYQAIARNAAGTALVSLPVGIRASILETSATGTAIYVETHTATTNNVGLFTLAIGTGTATTGTFSAINWATNSKFLKIEMDATGGTNYQNIGTTQLLSVPYALYAEKTNPNNLPTLPTTLPASFNFRLDVLDFDTFSNFPRSGGTQNTYHLFRNEVFVIGINDSQNAQIDLIDGEPEPCTLSMSGLPANVSVRFLLPTAVENNIITASQIDKSQLNTRGIEFTTTSNSAIGVSPVTLVATSASGKVKSRNFNLKINGNCAAGNYSGSFIFDGATGTELKISEGFFQVSSWPPPSFSSSYINATINCSTGNITIPSQTIFGSQVIIGTGVLSGNTITWTYTIDGQSYTRTSTRQ